MVFLYQSINTCLEINYFKSWYLVDIYKKLVIAMKTLGLSGVLNTPKILWYLTNHDIQNKVFYIFTKHLFGKKYHDILQYQCFVSKLLKYFVFKHPPIFSSFRIHSW
jgi:hypothetical protein